MTSRAPLSAHPFSLDMSISQTWKRPGQYAKRSARATANGPSRTGSIDDAVIEVRLDIRHVHLGQVARQLVVRGVDLDLLRVEGT